MAKANQVGLLNLHGLDDYGYLNVRIRGMSQRLLSQDDLGKLLKLPDLAAMESFLLGTDYGSAMKELAAAGSGEASQIDGIEAALQANQISSFQHLRKLLAGEPLDLYYALVTPFDIYNIKTMLRGVRSAADPAATFSKLLPVGQLTEKQLLCCVECKDSRQLITQLRDFGLAYVKPVEKQLDSYYYSHDLTTIEHALELCQYKQMLSYSSQLDEVHNENDYRLLADFVKLNIDLANVMLILKMAAQKISQSEALQYFLPGGKSIAQADFTQMILLADIDAIVARLLSYKFCKPMEAKLSSFKECQNITVFERHLQSSLLKRLPNLFKHDPLGIAVMLNYIERKRAEIVNIRVILRAGLFGMPEEITRGELVLV